MRIHFGFNFLGMLMIGFSGCGGCPGSYQKVDFGGGRIEYSSDITAEKALKLAQVLQREWTDINGIACRVEVVDRRYVVKIPVKPGGENDARVIADFRRLGGCFSREVFDSLPVDIALCDLEFNTLRMVDFQPLKPSLPVRVTFRKSIGGGSLVAQYQNTSDRHLHVQVVLHNATVGDNRIVELTLRPQGTQEHGWLEGWKYVSGETILVRHADYESLRITVP